MKNKVTYQNRQVKNDDELFAPNDPDSIVVGGKEQVDPFGYLQVFKKPALAGTAADASVEDGLVDEEPAFPDENDEEELEKLGSITSMSFEQEGTFTGDGTYLANVTLIFEDVKGATDYEIEFQKLS